MSVHIQRDTDTVCLLCRLWSSFLVRTSQFQARSSTKILGSR